MIIQELLVAIGEGISLITGEPTPISGFYYCTQFSLGNGAYIRIDYYAHSQRPVRIKMKYSAVSTGVLDNKQGLPTELMTQHLVYAQVSGILAENGFI